MTRRPVRTWLTAGGWIHFVGVVGVCLLACFPILSITAPITHEEHNWRQADTYSVAYSFHEEGFDFLRPRIDLWRGPTGIVGMEAPIFPALTHGAMYLLGEHPRAARALSFSAFVFALILAFRWLWLASAPTHERRTRTLCLLVAIALSPMALCEFRQVQPDGFSVSLTLVAAAMLARFANTRRRIYYAAGLAIYSVAVVCKSPALSAAPALFLLSWVGTPDRPSLRMISARAVGFLIPMAICLAWYEWAASLTREYETLSPYVNYGSSWGEIVRNLRRSEGPRQVLGFLLGTYAINWVALPAALVGLPLCLRAKERRLGVPMLVWLLGTLALCFAFSGRATVHWYYAAVLFPPAAYFTALGLASLGLPDDELISRWAASFLLLCLLVGPALADAAIGREAPAANGSAYERTWIQPRGLWALAEIAGVALCFAWPAASGRMLRSRLCRSMTAVIVVVASNRAVHDELEAFSFRTRSDEWSSIEERYRLLREMVDATSTRDDLFLVDGANPWFLHLARRRGLVGDSATKVAEEACRTDKGVGFYIHYQENAVIPEAMERSILIASNPHFQLYRLQPPFEGRCLIQPKDLPTLPDVGPTLEAITLARMVMLENTSTKTCIGATASEGAELKPYGCDPADAKQQLRMSAEGDGVVIHKIDETGRRYCVDAKGGPGAKLRMSVCNGSTTQVVRVLRARRTTVFIQTRASGLVWDLPPNSNGKAATQQFDFHGGPCQQWQPRYGS